MLGDEHAHNARKPRPRLGRQCQKLKIIVAEIEMIIIERIVVSVKEKEDWLLHVLLLNVINCYWRTHAPFRQATPLSPLIRPMSETHKLTINKYGNQVAHSPLTSRMATR